MLSARSVSAMVVLAVIHSPSAIVKAQDVAAVTGVVTDQTGRCQLWRFSINMR